MLKTDTVDYRIINFILLRVRKCGFTHVSRAEIRIFIPRDIKFRTILVRKTFSDECEFAARAEGE